MKRANMCVCLTGFIAGAGIVFADGVEIRASSEAELLAVPSKIAALPEAERAKGVTVLIAPGTYHLAEPLKIGASASGVEGAVLRSNHSSCLGVAVWTGVLRSLASSSGGGAT